MNGSTVLIYKSVGTKSPDTAGTVNTPILTGKSNFQLIRISSEFFFSLFTEIVTQGRMSWKDNLAKSVLHLSGIADPHTRKNALHVFDRGLFHMFGTVFGVSPH